MARKIIQGVTVLLATLLLIYVLAIFVDERGEQALVSDFAQVELKALNLYEDVISIRNSPIGTRITTNVDENVEVDDGIITEETDDGDTTEYHLDTYLQGETCPGENEIVRLVGGVAICCGSCPADIQLEFPQNVMCSLNSQTNWKDCEYFSPGTLHSVAVECANPEARVTVVDAEGSPLGRTGPSAQWGEYLIFEFRRDVEAGPYEIQIECDGEETERLLVRSGGGAGGGGSGGGGENNGGDDNGGGESSDPFANFQWPRSDITASEPRYGYAWEQGTPQYPSYSRIITAPQLRSLEPWNMQIVQENLSLLPEGHKVVNVRNMLYRDEYGWNEGDLCIDPDTGLPRVETDPYDVNNQLTFRCFWRENGVIDTKQIFSNILTELQNYDVSVDVFMLDTEIGASGWQVGTNRNNATQNLHWNVINEDPRFNDSDYEFSVLPQLLDIGYIPLNAKLNETVYYYGNRALYEGAQTNYLRYNTVMKELERMYLNDATYNVIKQTFPNAKVGDYKYVYNDNASNIPSRSGHLDRMFGTGGHVGTHQSPVTYGWLSGIDNFDFDFDGVNEQYSWFQANDFNSLRFHQNRFRDSYIAAPDIPMYPWISRRDWPGDDAGTNYLANSDYFQEHLLHMGMFNVESFYYWNAPWVGDANLDDAQLVSDLLEEMDFMVGYDEKVILSNDILSWQDDYVLTTVKFNRGFKLSRFTPQRMQGENTSEMIVEDTSNRKVTIRSGDNNSVWVRFDNAMIYEYANSRANAGFWIFQTSGAEEPYVVATCGNGQVEWPYETCDDSNTESGDGCSNTCQQEIVTQCSDGIDNDGDGAIDWPADFSCTDATDDDETQPMSQCQDGIDNDGDGNIDYQNDRGCDDTQDNDELGDEGFNRITQCNDGIDNDGDGNVDWPFDLECSSYYDNDESASEQCDDVTDDRQYLMDVTVNIATDNNGDQTFEVLDAQGNVLRFAQTDEKLVETNEDNILIDYTIVPRCGGVDVIYTLENNLDRDANLPKLRIHGLNHTVTEDVYKLKTFRHNKLEQLDIANTYFYDRQYPGKYIPGSMVMDDDFVTSAVLAYPYIDYRHTIENEIRRHDVGQYNSTWSIRFNEMTNEWTGGDRFAKSNRARTQLHFNGTL